MLLQSFPFIHKHLPETAKSLRINRKQQLAVFVMVAAPQWPQNAARLTVRT